MNYHKLKDLAPNNTLYMKIDGKMHFIPFEDIPAVIEFGKLLDIKDDEIGTLEKKYNELEEVIRLIEIKLREKGIYL